MALDTEHFLMEKATVAESLSNGLWIAKGINTDETVKVLAMEIAALVDSGIFVASIHGGPGSGKTTLATLLSSRLSEMGLPAEVLKTDDYNLKTRTERDNEIENGADPRDFKDFNLLQSHITDLQAYQIVQAPEYDGITGAAIDRGVFPHILNPDNFKVLIIDTDFFPLSRDQYNLIIYNHVDSDMRLQIRTVRDMEERGATSRDVVRTSFEKRQVTQFYPITLPSMAEASILLLTYPKRINSSRREFTFTHDVILRK